MSKFNYDKYIKLRNKYKNLVNKISILRLFLFFLIVICFIIGSKNFIFNFFAFVFIGIFVVVIFVHDKYYKFLDYYNKYIIVLEQYKARMNGTWKNFSDKGEEYKSELFDDLNIVGNNSLFQYLSVCKTLGARDILIKKLSNQKLSDFELLNNQEAISELAASISFDVEFLVAMADFQDKKINLEDNFSIMEKSVGHRGIDLIFAIIFMLLNIIFLLLGYLKIISYNYFFAMFVFNFLVNFMYAFIYHEEFDNVYRISQDYYKLLNVSKVILKNNFESSKLKEILKNISFSSVKFKFLFFINDLNELRSNILSNIIFNGLFNVNIVVMFLYSIFLNKDTDILKKGICSIEELEALISLAGIGILRDDVCMPVRCKQVKLEFTNVKHPLVLEKNAVGNDFVGTNGVNVITGSNMGGKTTFIRTVGINILLMNAGTFVCADTFNSAYFKIFTSISVNDDISRGISTFYGELLRIKKAIDCDKVNKLVLIDEIFKGTNYGDRIYGAVNVIKKLNNNQTILFVTTHDFELCDVKIKNFSNYHFKEYYEGDNIEFDYKLRPGKCEGTNARYLMEKLKILP